MNSKLPFTRKVIENYPLPLRLLYAITLFLLLAEVVISFIIFELLSLQGHRAWLLDVLITTCLVFPALYYLSFRPLLAYLQQRQQVESELRKIQLELQDRVSEQTGALVISNLSLQREVEERRRAEAQVRLQVAALEAAANGIVITDCAGLIQWTNPAFSDMTGYAREEMIGKNPRLLKSGKHPPEFYLEMWQTILAGKIWEGEIINRRKDSSSYIEEQTIAPVRNEIGKISHFIAIKQDVTQRKQAEQARAAERQRLFSLLEELPAVVYVQDQEYNIRFANRRFRERFGPANGSPCYKVIHKRSTPCEKCPTLQVLVTQQPVEWEWTSPDGRDYQFYDYPFIDVDGTLLALELGIDVTERKQAEASLEQRNRELVVRTESERSQRQLSDALVQAALALSSSLQTEEVLDQVMGSVLQAIPCEAALLMLLDGTTLRLVRYRGMTAAPEEMERAHLGVSLDHYHRFYQVVTTRLPVLVPDLGRVDDRQHVEGMEWVQSHLSAPLLVDGNVIGLISLLSKQAGYFQEEMKGWLQAFAAHAVAAIQNANLYQAELSARRMAEVLSAASLALTHNLHLDAVLEALLEYISQLVPYDRACILLREEEDHFEVRAARGYPGFEDSLSYRGFSVSARQNLQIQEILETNNSLLVEDSALRGCVQIFPGITCSGTYLISPLLSAGRVIGICYLEREEAGSLHTRDVQFARALVGQAAVAVENAWLFEQVQTGRERMQQLSHRLVEIQENERRYVARELHDEASQALTSLLVGLRLLERDADRPGAIAAGITELKKMADGVIDDLHRLAKDLRPASLDHVGLIPALGEYIQSTSDKHGLTIQFESMGLEERLAPELETALYRVVQEAISNIVRHAKATRADVLLERRGGKLVVLIEDNGIGFETQEVSKSGRLGLVGLRERAEMLGGELVVESSPGKGATIRLEIAYER